jgi:hypothetical protein
MWARGQAAFPEILEGLESDVVVVLGRQVWQEMPAESAPPSLSRTPTERLNGAFTAEAAERRLPAACRARQAESGRTVKMDRIYRINKNTMYVRFKLDENVPGDAEAIFRSAGHDARTIRDEGLGGGPHSCSTARRRESGSWTPT